MHTSCPTLQASAPTDRPAFGLFSGVSAPGHSGNPRKREAAAVRTIRAGRPSAWPAEGLRLPVTGAMRPPGGGNAAMPPPDQVRVESSRGRSYGPFSGSLVQFFGEGPGSRSGYPLCEAAVHRLILLINRIEENPTDSSTEFSTNPFTKRASYDKNLKNILRHGKGEPVFWPVIKNALRCY